jgi:preprotein translocase subunit SecG
MHALILSIHIITCICLIIAVLLQAGKGADIGAVFGGAGSQALFGSAGPVDFLNRATRILVIVFMLTSLTLGYFVAFEKPSKSIMSTQTAPQPGVPAGPAVPEVPGAPPLSPTPSAPALPVAPPQSGAPAK